MSLLLDTLRAPGGRSVGERRLALLCIGEIGRRYNLGGISQVCRRQQRGASGCKGIVDQGNEAYGPSLVLHDGLEWTRERTVSSSA